ncbi:MAG: N-acetyltransferase [Pseudomonadota bacterium]
MSVVVRPERETDKRAIRDVTRLAFEGKSYADGDEHDLIDKLRQLGALRVSLVAVDADELIGQISFSPATNAETSGDWYTLGPLAVRPDRQGQGVGGELIESGIRALMDVGAAGCVLTGDPGYYGRHGFCLSRPHCPVGEPADYFMLRQLADVELAGRFAFHPVFYGRG